ncbi:hypothetical protein TNCV_1610701 [Trichonephila clavipes]|nr:hypothetical protein TNCV_1610701 [Trichonephila clavipes]
MADCEVEGTIASPRSIPPERAMSPTGERSDEGRNIRTKQNRLGREERQTRIGRAVIVCFVSIIWAKFSSATGNRSVAVNVSKGLKLSDDKFVSNKSFTEPDCLVNDYFFIQGFVKAEMKKRVKYKPSVHIRTTCQVSDRGLPCHEFELSTTKLTV